MDKRLHEVPAATQPRDLNQAFAQDAAKQEEAVYTPAYPGRKWPFGRNADVAFNIMSKAVSCIL